MKKLFRLLSVVSIVFMSCSSEDSPVSEPPLTNDGFVLKRMDVLSPTQQTGGVWYYDGNKLDRCGNETTYVKYHYTGDLITKMDFVNEGQLRSNDYYYYDGNQRLSSYKVLDYQTGLGSRFVYTYNDVNGTCVVTLFTGNLQTQDTPDTNFSRKLFFENGVVVKKQRSMVIDGNLETLTTEVAFDNKQNPKNAILGMSKLLLYENDNYGSPHNLISYTYSATNATIIDVDVIQYTYNSYGFPITQKLLDPYDDGSGDIEFKYFYQQP